MHNGGALTIEFYELLPKGGVVTIHMHQVIQNNVQRWGTEHRIFKSYYPTVGYCPMVEHLAPFRGEIWITSIDI